MAAPNPGGDSDVVVDIGAVVDATVALQRATTIANRVIGGAVVLGIVVVVIASSRTSEDAEASRVTVGSVVVAAACVVSGAIAGRLITRRARVGRSAVVARVGMRVVSEARAAGLPELDHAAVARALREDDNGPAPWFDPKLSPHTWPFWELAAAGQHEQGVVAEKSVEDRRLTLRRGQIPGA
ncbi:hypothetical protein [Curtobacterium sp. VKM Ac-2922]|uniref:hypothetical protein n=1 Tax=Curtobacterium sp. VKM Ac-2922 TaxID=2929475 RepID=UPI001FB2E920|nr:hypothetical protein [Curtobacterium sp. VKM Ac-2922]MCJ1715569.1 hypothetical protein [Curtobacterium sp. VKM Ac-2922]